MDASDIKFNFLEVFIMDTLSKYALSIRRFVVVSDTSVSNPPITPAKAIGLSLSVITRSFESNFLTCESSVVICSLFLAFLTDIVPNNLSLSKACNG